MAIIKFSLAEKCYLFIACILLAYLSVTGYELATTEGDNASVIVINIMWLAPIIPYLIGLHFILSVVFDYVLAPIYLPRAYTALVLAICFNAAIVFLFHYCIITVMDDQNKGSSDYITIKYIILVFFYASLIAYNIPMLINVNRSRSAIKAKQ